MFLFSVCKKDSFRSEESYDGKGLENSVVIGSFKIGEFCRLIDESKHHVLKAAHPSGLSASRGFFGCRLEYITNTLIFYIFPKSI